MHPGNWKKLVFSAVIIVITALLYFFNRYHFIHAEQLQLFRYDKWFIAENLAVPGGVSVLLEKFILQFNYYPLLGIAIFVGLLAIIYFLFLKIFDKLSFNTSLLALLPVSVILALQLNYNYHLRSTIAFLFILLLFYIFLKVRKTVLKNILIIILPILAFLFGGGYGLYLLILIVLTILIKVDNHYQPGLPIGIILSGLSALAIYFICRFVYVSPYSSIYQACTPINTLNGYLLGIYVMLLVFLPIILIFKNIYHSIFSKSIVVAGFYCVSVLIPYFAYDNKTEKFFEIEHQFAKGNYSEVVKLAGQYPGSDHLVLYLANIALSRTQQMGEKLFHFRQAFGPDGLYMKNEPINVSTIYGGALYQQLNYTNEARHWYFNNLVINGESPETLKKLVVFELVNGNYNVAKKYLTRLSQTFFYRKWAFEYYKYVKSPLLIESNEEMAKLRRCLATRDFYHDRFDLQLKSLLAMYPDNRAAFDYLVSYTLLKKDLNSFMDALSYLREFKMYILPVHFEEALLVCKTILPERAKEAEVFNISDETRIRFDQYVQLYSSMGNNPSGVHKMLAKNFKYTYWFYLDFAPYVSPDSEPNVQLFPQ
jgi:hypothetical protein